MNSKKKRIYSLLSSALIFSSLGFVSGMENNDDTKQKEAKQNIKPTKTLGKKRYFDTKRDPKRYSIVSYFNVIPRKGVCLEFSPDAKPFDYAVARLLAITGYASRQICGDKKGRITDMYSTPKLLGSTEPVVAALKQSLWNFNEESDVEQKQSVIDNCRYVEMWYRALIFGPTGSYDSFNKFIAGLSTEEKELTEFLRLCKCNCNINTNKCANQKKNELLETNPNVLNLGQRTEKMINEAVQNVLKSLAPKINTVKNEDIDWETGYINRKKCEFTIFNERMPEGLRKKIQERLDNHTSLGLEENEQF